MLDQLTFCQMTMSNRKLAQAYFATVSLTAIKKFYNPRRQDVFRRGTGVDFDFSLVKHNLEQE